MESLIKSNEIEKFRVDNSPLEKLIGDSASMKAVIKQIRECANSTQNVLIVGENGTGKTSVAKIIHALSTRADKPIVTFSCNTPASMCYSELFNSLTSTEINSTCSSGKLYSARNGTLFFQDICALDKLSQNKLLCEIKLKKISTDNQSKSSLNTRLICGAQTKVFDLARTGQFSEELLSHLETITIKLPPLRERRKGIIPLAQHFLKTINEDFKKQNIFCEIHEFEQSTIDEFLEYPWPGNIGQLKDVIQQSLVRAKLNNHKKISPSDIEPFMPPASFSDGIPKSSLKAAVENLEKSLITDSLRRNNHVLTCVCKELGIGRTTLWRKLKSYQLESVIGSNQWASS